MNDLISVILPTYNSIKYLDNAIQSILNQTYKNFELLVINDGSTDGTTEYLKSQTDQRFKIYNLEVNKGLVHALNLGLSEAKGQFIARMDSDDVSHPERFQKQLDLFKLNPEIGICGSFAQVIGGDAYTIEKPCLDFELRWWIFRGIPFIHPSVMIRTSVIREFDIQYDAGYVAAEDWEIWPRIAFKTKMHNIPETLINYRSHDAQVSTPGNKQQQTSFELGYKSFLRSIGIDDLKFSRIDLNALFICELQNEPQYIRLAFDFFKDLLNSKAILFFGEAEIKRQSAERLGYMLSNQSKYSWDGILLIFRSDFWSALNYSGVSLPVYLFKSLFFWKTKINKT